MRRPVVATDVGPSAELLGPSGEAGLLVSPDSAALSAALSELLGDAARRARLGDAGRRRVEARFGLDDHVRQMRVLYREVADAR